MASILSDPNMMRYMGQMGLGLLSAGQAQPPGVNRYQGLMQSFNMANQNLMQSQLMDMRKEEYEEKKKERMSQKSALSKLFGGEDPPTDITWDQGRAGMSDDERLGLVGQVSPSAAISQMYAKQKDPTIKEFKQGKKIITARFVNGKWEKMAEAPRWDKSEGQTQLNQEIAYYDSIGMPRNWGRDLAYGMVQVTQDKLGNPVIVNKRTKETVPVKGQAPQPTEQPTGLPTEEPSPEEELPVPSIEGAGAAFGGSGMLSHGIATAAGMVGIPAFEDAERARSDIEAGKTFTGVVLARDFGDRTTNQLRDQVLSLLPDPGQLTTGDQRAKLNLESALGIMRSALAREKAIQQSPGDYQAKTLDRANQSIPEMEMLIKMWEGALENWGGTDVDPQDAPVKFRALD